MKKLKSLNEDMKILHNSIDELTLGQREHEEHTDRAYSDTQERINFMNYRILEIRQITGTGGLSKVHIQRIKQMKRGSIFADRNDNCDDAELTEELLKESEDIVKQQVISVWKKKTDKEARAPSPSKSRTKSPTKTSRSKSPVKNSQPRSNSPTKKSRSVSPPKAKPQANTVVDTLTVLGEDNSEASSTKDSGYEEILIESKLNDKKSQLTSSKPIISDQKQNTTVSPRKTRRSTSPKKQRNSFVTESPKKRKKEAESKPERPPKKSSSFDSETVSIKSIKNDTDSQNDDDVFENDFFGING